MATPTKSKNATKKTPAEASSKQEVKSEIKSEVKLDAKSKSQDNSFIDRFKQKHSLHVIVMYSVLALVVTITILVWAVVQSRSSNTDEVGMEDTEIVDTKKNKKVIEEPTVLPRRTDGTIVAAGDANKVPACVMIENAAFSGVRPQAGVSAASLVYEVIVEGGITRWMVVFNGESADPVGPVRSARDTYLEFASELNCAYMHAGGSYTAMLALEEFSMRNLDALREPRWSWRDPAKPNPHDLFTKTDNLYEAVEIGHSWTEPSTFDMWNFVDDSELDALRAVSADTNANDVMAENTTTEETETANSEELVNEINIEFGGSYNAHYTWNADKKYYERQTSGVDHVDANTGNILTTRNIIIEHVPSGWEIEGKGRINYSVTGEGTVDIFRNGQHVQGTWRKPDRLSRTQYYDANGDLIPMARGTSWVEIVPEGIGTNWE